ncbi:MAG TPA: hypothetical protein VJ810_17445 [Blastocatellia bacterium]|nr:hypothetical protein [Blastocatellia bacterium]
MAATSSMNSTPDSKLFQRLYERSKRVEVDGATYWVVEGDTLLDEDQLRFYAQQQEALQQARAAVQADRQTDQPLVGITEPSTELVGIVQNRRLVRWSPGLDLSYCILRGTFMIGGEAGYQLTVDSLRKASEEWEKACGVRFVYKPELDGSGDLRPDGVVFTVRELDSGGRFIASAFFPNYPAHRRRVLIDPSFYSPSLRYDKIGVLRHELGHVLGFRHEQIRSEAPPGCPDEDTYGTINLTDYDPQSVMHYFCGGIGDKSMSITEKDKIGAQKVYGPPLGSFLFFQ